MDCLDIQLWVGRLVGICIVSNVQGLREGCVTGMLKMGCLCNVVLCDP